MTKVVIRMDMNTVAEKVFPSITAAKSYIVGAVHGETVAHNAEIPVCELQEQIKNKKDLRLGFKTWTIEG